MKWKLNFSCRVHLCLLVLLSFAPPFALALDQYEREVRRLGDLMDWKPGQTIAEIGAGEGQMSFFASERVGPSVSITRAMLLSAPVSKYAKGMQIETILALLCCRAPDERGANPAVDIGGLNRQVLLR